MIENLRLGELVEFDEISVDETEMSGAVSDFDDWDRTETSRGEQLSSSQQTKDEKSTAAVQGAKPAVQSEELDPGRERRPLESYFQEIGGTRTLKREEEVVLAKDLEAATAQLRDALYAIPSSAKHVVAQLSCWTFAGRGG